MEAQELSWVTPDTDISRRPLRMRMFDSRVFEYLILNVFVDFVDFVCCLTVSTSFQHYSSRYLQVYLYNECFEPLTGSDVSETRSFTDLAIVCTLNNVVHLYVYKIGVSVYHSVSVEICTPSSAVSDVIRDRVTSCVMCSCVMCIVEIC